MSGGLAFFPFLVGANVAFRSRGLHEIHLVFLSDISRNYNTRDLAANAG